MHQSEIINHTHKKKSVDPEKKTSVHKRKKRIKNSSRILSVPMEFPWCTKKKKLPRPKLIVGCKKILHFWTRETYGGNDITVCLVSSYVLRSADDQPHLDPTEWRVYTIQENGSVDQVDEQKVGIAHPPFLLFFWGKFTSYLDLQYNCTPPLPFFGKKFFLNTKVFFEIFFCEIFFLKFCVKNGFCKSWGSQKKISKNLFFSK